MLVMFVNLSPQSLHIYVFCLNALSLYADLDTYLGLCMVWNSGFCNIFCDMVFGRCEQNSESKESLHHQLSAQGRLQEFFISKDQHGHLGMCACSDMEKF